VSKIMDDKEHTQLDDIHDEVAGSKAQLGRIAERTRNIENHVDGISENVDKNASDINDLQDQVKRNSTIINAVTVGMSGVLLWIADKLTRINPF
jgi:archaellum component FlaC